MNIIKLIAAAAFLGLTLMPATSRAAEDLTGAIWASEQDYQWMVVSETGEIQTFTSTGHYLQVLQKHGNAYAIKIGWWDGLNDQLVEEHGVMIPYAGNVYHYREAGTLETTKGMLGTGYLAIEENGTARFSQIGARPGGSVSALVNALQRVETVPQLK